MTAHYARLFMIAITVLFACGALAWAWTAIKSGATQDWCQVGYHLCAALLQLTVMGMGK